MLILTRRIGESLKIGKDVTVMILNKSGNQIKIGIDAPKDVNIVRTELIGRDKEKAAGEPTESGK